MKFSIIFSRLLGIALVSLVVGCDRTPTRQPVRLSQPLFMEAFQSNWITRGQIIYDPQSPYLREVRGQLLKPGESEGLPFIAKVRLTETVEKAMLTSGRFETKEGR